MTTRPNIARRIEHLEQARRDQQPREPLQPPDWLNMNETKRYQRSELRPDELPPPSWLIDDE